MKRILLCNEGSQFKTGYSKYGRELMEALYNSGKYILAEHSAYIDPSKEDHLHYANNIPWSIYFNMPHKDKEPDRFQQYKNNQSGVFGGFAFESTCLDFKPDVVISFRDFWMDSFICNSPYRRIYKHAWMPTCDAEPQNVSWLSEFKKADAIFTYTDWSKKVLTNSGINVLDSCPPSCSRHFLPRGKEKSKELLGLDPDTKLIGTVMRNQRRKLYDDYLQSVAKYSKRYPEENILFHCHTSYPDKGWDFPTLLLEHGVCNKVVFTYVCNHCGGFFLSYWSDAIRDCRHCGNFSATLPNIKNGLNEEQFSYLYSAMDLYVQYANSEGFGVPAIEAAACGTPILATNYSAMEDVLCKLDGTPINPVAYSKELETGCYRAVPNNDEFVERLHDRLNNLSEDDKYEVRAMFEQNYNMQETADKWMKYLDIAEVANWSIKPDIVNPPPLESCPNGLTNNQYVKWLILNVLGDQTKIGSYFEARMIKDLNFGQTNNRLSSMYFNEFSMLHGQPEYREFGRPEAYNECKKIRDWTNFWENQRAGIN